MHILQYLGRIVPTQVPFVDKIRLREHGCDASRVPMTSIDIQELYHYDQKSSGP